MLHILSFFVFPFLLSTAEARLYGTSAIWPFCSEFGDGCTGWNYALTCLAILPCCAWCWLCYKCCCVWPREEDEAEKTSEEEMCLPIIWCCSKCLICCAAVLCEEDEAEKEEDEKTSVEEMQQMV